MTTITIPKRITRGEELIVIPRKDYEKLLELERVREFQPTASHKKALIKARQNRKSGKFLTLNELKHKLGFTS